MCMCLTDNRPPLLGDCLFGVFYDCNADVNGRTQRLIAQQRTGDGSVARKRLTVAKIDGVESKFD